MQVHVPNHSRRQFLRTLGSGALLATVPTQVWADEMDSVTISILHTTDLHGHILPTVDYHGHADLGGLARCAAQIRAWRRENPNSLYLDVGDIYQGTEFGLMTRGQTMIRCLNALACDAWVVGNHEFDWGLADFVDAVELSAMPVLSGNALVQGQRVGELGDSTGPLAKMRPYLIKEVAGFRLAIIGLTTPGLCTWLPPENLCGFEVADPVEALRPLVAEIESQRPDAIILAGHMGLKRRDDYANPLGALTRAFPQITVCLGGHTHQNRASETSNGVLYTQADHYGIYAGKVDLTFDRARRVLLQRTAVTVPMDHHIALDPVVLSIARNDLDAADLILARAMGELQERFEVNSAFGAPSDVERLIGSAIFAALRVRGVEIDAVVHGLFEGTAALEPGMKTIADAWSVAPFDNDIVTIEVGRDDLVAMVNELGAGPDFRNVMGLRVVAPADATSEWTVTAPDGSPLPSRPSFRIALNSFDSQSAGGRFPMVARLVSRTSSRRVLHTLQVRDALIDFFVTRRHVSRSALLV